MQERRAVASLSGRVLRLAIALVVAAVVVSADQVTKSLAVAHVTRPTHLVGPFGLALGYNSGSAFSLFTGAGPGLVVIAAVLSLAFGWWAWRAASWATVACLGLVVGGAVGNAADRLFRGHHGGVVDFITLTHWPTFNVADACITVGLLLLALTSLRRPLLHPG